MYNVFIHHCFYWKEALLYSQRVISLKYFTNYAIMLKNISISAVLWNLVGFLRTDMAKRHAFSTRLLFNKITYQSISSIALFPIECSRLNVSMKGGIIRWNLHLTVNLAGYARASSGPTEILGTVGICLCNHLLLHKSGFPL